MSPTRRELWPSAPASALSRRSALVGLGALGLSGCAGRQKGPCLEEKVDKTIPLRIHASTRLNRDPELRSLPTHVRLYTVKDVSEVRSVSFDTLWKKGDEALPKTLVASEELVVHPGAVMDLDFTLAPEGVYLVAAGIFRQPAGTSWRAIHRLPPMPRCVGRYRKKWPAPPAMVHLIVEDNRIRASDEPPPPPPASPQPRAPEPPPEERVLAPRKESSP